MSYGPEKLRLDLQGIGYASELVVGTDNVAYAILRNFIVPSGRFINRTIDLGIPAPNDYPRRVGASIHVKADPQLYDYKDTIPGVRNIIQSGLGPEWRYWSFQFNCRPEETASATPI